MEQQRRRDIFLLIIYMQIDVRPQPGRVIFNVSKDVSDVININGSLQEQHSCRLL